MKNFKPSELPVGTTIESDYDTYTKVDNSTYGLWWENSRCEDCQGGLGFSNKHIDEELKDFKIVALPFSVVEYMARELSNAIETDFGGFYIKKAIKHHLDPEDTCTHPYAGDKLEGCC